MTNQPMTSRRPRDHVDYDPNQTIMCMTITRSDGAGGYTCPLDEAPAWLSGELTTDPEVGESLTITYGVYTERELDNMREFDGW